MPASEQAYPAGPDGEPHLATVDRDIALGTAAESLGQLSEQVDHAPADAGFTRPEAPAPERDKGPDN